MTAARASSLWLPMTSNANSIDQPRAVHEHAPCPRTRTRSQSPTRPSRNRGRATAPETGRSPRPSRARRSQSRHDCPAARCRCVHAMNRSNPSTVAGGGEMKRVTSAFIIAAKSDAASLVRSSRSVIERSGQLRQPRPPVVRLPFGLRRAARSTRPARRPAAVRKASSPSEAASGLSTGDDGAPNDVAGHRYLGFTTTTVDFAAMTMPTTRASAGLSGRQNEIGNVSHAR